MTRIIRIETCRDCRYHDHQGAFGKIAYVPVCSKSNRELPHEVMYDQKSRMVVAEGSNVIPDWCPLEKMQCS